MQALERAIAERIPLEGLAHTSPLSGLRRRRVGAIDIAAQSVAAVAPTGVALVNPGEVGETAGGFAVIAFAATVVVVVLLSLTMSVFVRRIASAGSLYTFTVRGLGRTGGLIAGTALAVGYLGIAAACLLDSAQRVAALIATTPVQSAPPVLSAVIVVVFATLVAVAIVRGVRISTRVLLVVEVLGMLVIAGVAVAVFSASGWDFSALAPSFEGGVLDGNALLSGLAVGLVAFVGFESGIALGPEARRPLAAVPRALMWTVIAVCLSYLVGVSAHLVGTASAHGGRTASNGSDVALAGIGESVGLTGIAPWIDVIVALSFLACTLATTIALARLTLVMSREGLLPRALGRTGRRGTPAIGGVVITAIVTAAPLLALVFSVPDDIIDQVADTAILGYVIAYILVAIAAPVFLVRIGEFRWIDALPAAVVSTVLTLTLLHSVITGTPGHIAAAWTMVALIAVIAALFRARVSRDPGTAARLGMYDSPIAADSIGGRDAGASGMGAEAPEPVERS